VNIVKKDKPLEIVKIVVRGVALNVVILRIVDIVERVFGLHTNVKIVVKSTIVAKVANLTQSSLVNIVGFMKRLELVLVVRNAA